MTEVCRQPGYTRGMTKRTLQFKMICRAILLVAIQAGFHARLTVIYLGRFPGGGGMAGGALQSEVIGRDLAQVTIGAGFTGDMAFGTPFGVVDA